jgi:hypothetical protein
LGMSGKGTLQIPYITAGEERASSCMMDTYSQLWLQHKNSGGTCKPMLTQNHPSFFSLQYSSMFRLQPEAPLGPPSIPLQNLIQSQGILPRTCHDYDLHIWNTILTHQFQYTPHLLSPTTGGPIGASGHTRYGTGAKAMHLRPGP